MDLICTIKYNGKIVGNNQRYKYRGKKIYTVAYKAFKDELGWIARSQTNEVSAGELFVDILYNSRHDVDNIAKGILDGLENIVFDNDRQVKKLNIERVKNIDHTLIIYVYKI